MLFNSFQFIYFFIIIVTLYFMIPHKYRWILLLVASYYFYMCWKIEYIFLILFSTFVDYFAGIHMEKSKTKRRKAMFLAFSLITNLGLLFTFKYFNFFNDSFRMLFNHINIAYHIPQLNVLLPVGISFYTFQTLSYSIDVYRGVKKAEHHLGIFALYVAFFPQLVAGPIERSTRLMPQFRKRFDFDYKKVTDGLKLMMWGFFKKLVIADRLAIYVNQVYNNPHSYTGWPVIIATYFFAFQIYCDFSGYSDIAIGAAQVMGFNLMENFRRPYFAKTIPEFWRRWHISLSTWFRDYLYIPLGGNRVKQARFFFNVFITFLISGLWHGANWTFVIWGALHGFYMLITMVLTKPINKMYDALKIPKRNFFRKLVGIFITFHLTLLSWVFFRANKIKDIPVLFGNMFKNLNIFNGLTLSLLREGFIVAVISLLVLLFVQLIQRRGKMRHFLDDKSLVFRWAMYILIISFILLFAIDNGNQFIYFQF
ncbi:MBOAT family protein [bacterium]|nr:MBOAT family protein [bacterium]